MRIIPCPACQLRCHAAPAALGHAVRCPRCRARFTARAAAAAPDPISPRLLGLVLLSWAAAVAAVLVVTAALDRSPVLDDPAVGPFFLVLVLAGTTASVVGARLIARHALTRRSAATKGTRSAPCPAQHRPDQQIAQHPQRLRQVGGD
jgi:hypothetical protein